MSTSSVVAPEYARFVADLRRAERLGPPPQALAEGNVLDRVHVDPGSASRLMRTAALRAAGIHWKSSRDTIVWAEGGRELAVVVGRLEVETGDGLLVVHLPVRCDQVGDAVVTVTFAVGSEDRPAGLYAAAERRPRGPAAVVDAWSESLVAFAWQCLLGLLTGLTGAVGKDERGNLLVPGRAVGQRRRLVRHPDGPAPVLGLVRAPAMTLDLGPVSSLATALGLLTPGGDPNPAWFGHPEEYLATVLAEEAQREALVAFVDDALGGEDRTTDAAGAVWLPVVSLKPPQPLLDVSVVIDDTLSDDFVAVGLGLSVRTVAPASRSTIHVPLFRAAKKNRSVADPFLLGAVGGRIQVATEVTVGDPHLASIGLGLDVPTAPGDEAPAFSLTLRGIQLPGAPATPGHHRRRHRARRPRRRGAGPRALARARAARRRGRHPAARRRGPPRARRG